MIRRMETSALGVAGVAKALDRSAAHTAYHVGQIVLAAKLLGR